MYSITYTSLYLFIIIYSFIHIHFSKITLSLTHSLMNVFIYLVTYSFIAYLFHLLIINLLLHSPFIHLSIHSLLSCTGSVSPSLPTYTCSSLFPSTASYQEEEPASGLGPLVLTPRTFSSILTSSLLNCAGVCPGVQRIRFPLRNRCSCNYCFDFHPLMPENSFHKLLLHEVRQPLSPSRVRSAWGFRFHPGSWQVPGSQSCRGLGQPPSCRARGPGMSWRGRQACIVVDFVSQVKGRGKGWPVSGLWSHDPSGLRLPR